MRYWLALAWDRLRCRVGNHWWHEGYEFMGLTCDYCGACGKTEWREVSRNEYRET